MVEKSSTVKVLKKVGISLLSGFFTVFFLLIFVRGILLLDIYAVYNSLINAIPLELLPLFPTSSWLTIGLLLFTGVFSFFVGGAVCGYLSPRFKLPCLLLPLAFFAAHLYFFPLLFPPSYLVTFPPMVDLFPGVSTNWIIPVNLAIYTSASLLGNLISVFLKEKRQRAKDGLR